MLQSVLMTALTPLSNTDEITSWENRPFTTIWPEPESQVKSEISKGPELKKTIKKRKAKRFRTAYTTEQIRALERIFSKSRYIDIEVRKQVADNLNITEKSIKIWFQNRRMKEKRDSESSCDSSVSESFVTSKSPASCPKTPDIIKQNVEVNHVQVEYPTSTYPEFVSTNDFENAQYQFPTYQYNGFEQYHNIGNVASEMFTYDPNVYPTHYYPSAGYYPQQDENVNQYCENNWNYNLETGYYC